MTENWKNPKNISIFFLLCVHPAQLHPGTKHQWCNTVSTSLWHTAVRHAVVEPGPCEGAGTTASDPSFQPQSNFIHFTLVRPAIGHVSRDKTKKISLFETQKYSKMKKLLAAAYGSNGNCWQKLNVWEIVPLWAGLFRNDNPNISVCFDITDLMSSALKCDHRGKMAIMHCVLISLQWCWGNEEEGGNWIL